MTSLVPSRAPRRWRRGPPPPGTLTPRPSPESEYRAGHIPGARSAPLAALPALAAKLPRRRQIVAYCRGPYCVYADDAVRLLQARGLKARRLDVGLPEWRQAGLPVETSCGRARRCYVCCLTIQAHAPLPLRPAAVHKRTRDRRPPASERRRGRRCHGHARFTAR
jgi:rhodanese-related sulfurtransferase